MDKRIDEIVQGFKRLIGGYSSAFIATVTADSDTTCTVKDFNGAEYPDVRKSATEGTVGVVPLLKQDSYVLVARISGSDDLYIAMFSEITGLKINGDVVFNNGTVGMVKADELKEQLNKVTARIDAIASVLSTGSNGGGAVVFAGMSSPDYVNAMANKENFNNLENEKVKQ